MTYYKYLIRFRKKKKESEEIHMTYIWYTNNMDTGYASMYRQLNENNDTILESIVNNKGWAHLEGVTSDYIVIPANEGYSDIIMDVIQKSCKPVFVKTDNRLIDNVTQRVAKLGMMSDVDIKVFR